jgi:monofunctional biosynthetic peptidoglycan transglycosylase
MRKRLLAALPLAIAGALWFWFLTVPWPLRLRAHTPESTAFMRMRAAEARADGATLEIDHRPVTLDQIAPALRNAVIVAEDGRFREHDGIDWHAIAEEVDWRGDDDFSWFSGADLRALFTAIRYYRDNAEKIRGRSTITQQLAKNLYFSSERSLLRKIEELIVARRMERMLSKDRILELYLNTAEFGPGIFGVEAAARHYFGRSADALTRDQAAALAATLPHPLTSNPDLRPGRMAWRKRLILARMGGTGPVETVPLEPPGVEVEDPALLGEVVSDSAAADTAVRVTPPADTVIAPPDTVPEPADTTSRSAH